MSESEEPEVQSNRKKEIHFLKKPLYFWTKSFADKEIRREDTFSKFLTSNALNYALEYIGIVTENEQSSLHLSAIFDEEAATSSSSRTTKYTNQVESETKSRIQVLNSVFNELTSYFEGNFSQLVVSRPPNSLHVSTGCAGCAVGEYEKILFLLLGAAVQGAQKQDAMRKIKGFPKEIQEELIESIKHVTQSPELIHVKPWSEYCRLDNAQQQRIYDNLLSHLRRLIIERNDVIQRQFLSDYFCGFTNCDQRRSYESSVKGSGSTGDSLDFDKYSDESRTSAAMRQLREELIEKSDLLQECREELEMTKGRVQELENEVLETQKQLRSCKKSRDEYDVLREGQEKATRLESELQRMKKKLEDSEQYYERVEILQNENRNHQRKHAILMDQINMLTVEKERLEVSFLTQQQNSLRNLSGHFSETEDLYESSFNRRSSPANRFEDELLLDTDDEIEAIQDQDQNPNDIISELSLSEVCSPLPAPETTSTNLEPEEIPELTIEIGQIPELPAIDIALSPPRAQVIDFENEIIQIEAKTNPLVYEQDLIAESSTESQTEPEISVNCTGNSSGLSANMKTSLDQEDEEAVVPQQKLSKSERRSKRGSRKTSTLNIKRTRKSLFGSSKVTLQKVTSLSSNEKLDEIALHQQMSESNSPMSSPMKSSGRRHHHHRRTHSSHHRKRSSKDGKQVVPSLDIGNEADEELSLSPNCRRHGSSSSGSEGEARVGRSRGARDLFLRRPSPHKRGLKSSRHIYPYASPTPPERYGALEESENEFFFVCSTTVPATARNVKIGKGRGVPLVQVVSGGSLAGDPEPSDGVKSRMRQSEGSENGEQDREAASQVLSRCNISVNLRHINTNSHQLSLNSNSRSPEPEESHFRPSVPNPHAFAAPLSAKNESSSEDDDSVWYEYGCV